MGICVDMAEGRRMGISERELIILVREWATARAGGRA